MPSRKAVHHRTLWISDVHLGSPNCKAKRLVAFLRHNRADRLYLVGDIFDGWKLTSRFHWTPEQSAVVNAVLDKARRGTDVFYVTGNHDAFLRQFMRGPLRFGAIHLVNEVVHTTADGRRLLVLHGDAFDHVIAALPRLSKLGDRAYEFLIWFNQRLDLASGRLGLGRWSLSSTVKTLVKGAAQFLSGFDEQVMLRCRRDRLQGVVCGHTHHAEARGLCDGIVSYNCGDWVESCTALAEDFNGSVSVLKGEQTSRLHAAPPPAELRARTRPGPLIIAAASPRARVKTETASPEPDDVRPLSAAAARRGTPGRSHRSENRPHP